MNYLISYDISDDRQRDRLAKLLERRGCSRVQKSVFLAPNFKPEEIILLKSAVLRLITKKTEPNNSILCIPIEKDLMTHAVWYGNKSEWKKIQENTHSIVM